MRKQSFALENFKNLIAIAETLLARERKYKEPLKLKNFKIVQGLRGGALVLMVASFENFLKEVMEERLNELTTSSKFNFTSLPPDIVHYNHSKTLEYSLKPSIKLDKPQKIIGYVKASRFVVDQKINPEAFSITIRSNPNSERLIQFFNSIGHNNFFSRIKIRFGKKMGKTIDIQTTLDSIIFQRHQVAHAANAINLSRYELGQYIKFLKILAEMCDEELYSRICILEK